MNADQASQQARVLAGETPDYERIDGIFDGVPRDECAEDALIVAVLKKPSLLDGLDLESRDFWGLRYRVCWSAILRLHQRGELEPRTAFVGLLQELRRMGREDANVLVADLWQTNGLAADARVYLARIKDMRDKRDLTSGSAEDVEALYDSSTPTEDVLTRMEQRIARIRRRRAAGQLEGLALPA